MPMRKQLQGEPGLSLAQSKLLGDDAARYDGEGWVRPASQLRYFHAQSAQLSQNGIRMVVPPVNDLSHLALVAGHDEENGHEHKDAQHEASKHDVWEVHSFIVSPIHAVT